MIFLIGNRTSNYTICFPIFIVQDPQILTFPFSLLLILEALLSVISAFYVLKVLIVCVRIRAFHRNMTVLIFMCAFQWIESVAANLMIKPYEMGVWTLGADPTTTTTSSLIKQWWTSDESKMIRIPDLTPFRFFFLGGFLKWHYILSMVLMLSILSIERVFACYFIDDYEKKSRNALLFCIVFGFQSICFVATMGFFWNIAHFVVGLGFIVTPNLLAVGILAYTRTFNRRMCRQIENTVNSHTYLPARFQARENIKCFEMIQKVIVSAFFLILFACAVNVIMFLEMTPRLDTLWNLLFENAIHLNPLIICPTLLHAVSNWNRFSLVEFLCHIRRLNRPNKVSSISVEGGGGDGPGRNEQTRKETDAYFDQLNAAWT